MQAMQALKDIAKEQNKSLYRISLDIGKTKQFVSSTITNGSNPRTDTYAKMLATCNYTLCAVPNERVDNEHMYVID